MKRTISAVRQCAVTMLLFCLLLGAAAAETPSVPAWEKHVPPGGQLDDTAFPDVLQWLSDPRSRAEICVSGQVAASTIVNNARSLVGKYPYVYGGESPEEGGFDCTGLVWYVYNRMSGLNISLSEAGRSKAALAAAGEQIYDHDAFLPGDVIQFTYAHVAIYVGDGRVVHARTTGTMIQETDLNYNNVEYAVRYPGVLQNVIVASGACGDSLSWILREDGTLTVSGEGDMPDYADENAVPWYSRRDSIKRITLEEGVTAVGSFAFSGCQNLTAVTAPGITKIGHAAFYECTELSELSLSDDITYIGQWAFSRCIKLSVVDLPENLTVIDTSAFYGCTGLVAVMMPETLETLGDAVFENCSALTSIRFSDLVTRIGDSAFFGCTSLTSLALGSGITAIDDYAFYGCTNLTAIAIPKGVETIGDWAFSECPALRQVTYGGLKPQWEDIRMGQNNAPLLSANLVCTGKPDAPVAAAPSFTESGIPLLFWDAVKYADKYEVWRSADGINFEKIAETESTGYIDTNTTPGTLYYYRIRAVTDKIAGEYSNTCMVFRAARAPLGVKPE